MTLVRGDPVVRGIGQSADQQLPVLDGVPVRSRYIAEKLSVMAAALAAATVALAADPAPAAPEPARRNELITLVRHDCGSCHGITLQGGLGPALLPETLADKDPESLKATILHGRPGTPMPPWKRFVSETEAEWIVTNLQKGFPN